VPSSSDGAAPTEGAAATSVGGAIKNGKSWVGCAAIAEPENAIAPIASAPKAAARREVAINLLRLSIGRPLSHRLLDWLGASSALLKKLLPGKGFSSFA
jgi:hypothetical protein